MKSLLSLFLYLNICTCFFSGIHAQELKLSIKTEPSISKGIYDSLQIKAPHPNFESLRNEVDTIQLKFQRMGFIESELLEIRKKNDSNYTALFNLGKKYAYIKVYYKQKDFSKKELQRVASEVTESYFIIPLEQVPPSLEKLTSLRNQKGNAFARLRLTEFEKEEDGQLTAALSVYDGAIRRVDSIAIKGYEKFPRSFLRFYAGVKKGMVFNKLKLVGQNDNLNSLGFVSAIKPPEALFRKDTTIVYFYLEKQNNNLFDGIIGFATDEETQKLNINGYLNLELNNNLNFGEQLLLNYKADGNEQVNFKAKVMLPYLFKTPFGLSGELKIFKQDSTFVTTQQQVGATYQINPRSSAHLGYSNFDSSNLLDNVLAGTPIEDFKARYFVAGARYLKSQNAKMFPIKTQLSIDGAMGKREAEGSKDDQIRIETLVSNIFNLNRSNSIYAQNTTSILFSNSYLANELFRFGGINSIRGFNENSIDASLYSIINTEYRYQFNEGVYVHSIIDVGYFENETRSIKQQLYSFGFGLGLNTKAGLFKLNVANGNSENQDVNFSNTKIHISVSSKF